MRDELQELKYFLYVRKSTESDDRQAASIDDQISEMNRVAKRLGLNVVDIITESRSAKKPGRPNFNKMVERIHSGEADAILCWKLNRLARNPVDGGQISWMIQQNVIKHIQSFTSEFHPEDNVLIMQIEFGMANQYVKDLSVDTKRGHRKKAERGWYPSGTLNAGYRHVPNTSNSGKDEIETDQNFVLMKSLWNKLLTGKYTVADIKREGDKIGIRNRAGKEYSINNYHAMFANEFYCGWYYWLDENGVHQRIKGKHKPMITEDEFRKVRIFLGGNGNKNRISKYTFPFRGALHCGECKRMITADQKIQVRCTNCRHKYSIKQNIECPKCQTTLPEMDNPVILDKTYYICVGATKKKCSQRGSVEQGELEKQIDRVIEGISIPKDFHDWAVDAIQFITKNEGGEEQQTLNVIRNRESDLEQRLTKMTILRADGEITPEHFSSITKDTEKELNDIRVEIKRIHKNKIDWAQIANQYLTFSETAHEKFENGDPNTKKLVFESISQNLILKDKMLSVSLPKPLIGIRSAFKIMSKEIGGFEPEKALEKQGLFLQISPSNTIGLRGQDSNL